jgi:hypothetical protein
MSETDDDRTGGQAGDPESDGGSILDGGIDTDARAGRSQGIDPDAEPDEETQQEIEQTREERLAPENRPDGAEVDNTQRTFDTDRGMFTDNDDYTEEAPAPFADPEESS